MIEDAERLTRMEHHLLNDSDLIERNRALIERERQGKRASAAGGRGMLSEAARRAIKDLPRPSDVAADGTISKTAADRLTGKFGFSFDIAGRGVDDRGAYWDGKRRPRREPNA